ncbi:MAG TPA: hypothetical protein PLV06_11845 [Bacteroidales bacterium]|nr:hypothetical protein [Bacteroidales bacterium]HPR13070.1 hypothetical protein [Bacteroidales bacterium]
MYSLQRIIVSLVVFFSFSAAFCDNPFLIKGGPGEAGMGSVCIMHSGFWSSFSNQALLALNDSWSAGFNYQSRFNIQELGTTTAAAVFPAGNSSVGLIFSHFGYSEFRRSMTGAACGLQLTESIAAGLQIDYFFENFSADYDSYHSVTFEAGLFFRPSERVSAAIHVFNPVPASLRNTMMPSTLRAGAGIQLGSTIFAGAEAEMSTGEKLILKSGLEYGVSENLWLRGGFSSEFTSFSFGLGYMLRWLRIDLSFVTHERLGISSAASLVFKIK